MYTIVEENYIKAIFRLEKQTEQPVKTNALSEALGHKPSTTTETLDRLAKKRLIWYVKYKGVELSPLGKELALRIIRRHRLWEYFLHEKLEFTWDEVHDMAEELEHISFPILIERLDEFLGRPKNDPHGEFIPDQNGRLPYIAYKKLPELATGSTFTIKGVSCDSKSFLQHLDKLSIRLGQMYTLQEVEEFDRQFVIASNGESKTISQQVARELWVE